MADATKIAWTDHTMNWWMGCFKVSQGCKNCYADTLTSGRMGLNVFGPDLTQRKRTSVQLWNKPRRWNRDALMARRPEKVFTLSLGDFFEDAPGPNAWREEAWDIIRECYWLDWQILTKRPQNVARMLPDDWDDRRLWPNHSLSPQPRSPRTNASLTHQPGGWPHVWLGTSCEDNRVAERASILAEVRAFTHFVSYEPAIGPGDEIPLEGIEWMIVGGESGPGYRKMDLDWARDMQRRCAEESVAYFFKQNHGARTEMGIDALGAVYRDFPESWDRKAESLALPA